MTESPIFNIQLENVRIARVSLARPFQGRADKSGKLPEPKYHVDCILEETHPQLERVKALMRGAIEYKFKDQAPVVMEQIAANNKLPLHRGNVDRAGKPEYANKLFISANNADQPTIVVQEGNILISNRGSSEVLSPSHPKYPYSGSYADVILNFVAYAHETGGKGVSAYVNGVFFREHGEPLRGSSVAAISEFKLRPQSADGALPPAQTSGPGAGLI